LSQESELHLTDDGQLRLLRGSQGVSWENGYETGQTSTKYFLKLQGDGNLLLREGTPEDQGKVVWKSNKTSPNTSHIYALAVDRVNNQLVIYDMTLSSGPEEHAVMSSGPDEGTSMNYDTVLWNVRIASVLTETPSLRPSEEFSISPSEAPNTDGSVSPSIMQSNHPSKTVSFTPSLIPSGLPSIRPSESSEYPSLSPTDAPSSIQSRAPSPQPDSSAPSDSSLEPSSSPSYVRVPTQNIEVLMKTDDILLEGNSIKSLSQESELHLTDDGQLRLLRGSQGVSWENGYETGQTSTKYFLKLQGDGNLLLREGTPEDQGKVVWKSNKTSPNTSHIYALAVDRVNNQLVIYDMTLSSGPEEHAVMSSGPDEGTSMNYDTVLWNVRIASVLTETPSLRPSEEFSISPSEAPNTDGSVSPSIMQSNHPSKTVSFTPSLIPSGLPSIRPSESSEYPSLPPTDKPSSTLYRSPPAPTKPALPGQLPYSSSITPSGSPTSTLSSSPTSLPTPVPSHKPSYVSSEAPSLNPTLFLSSTPSLSPTSSPTPVPSQKPSYISPEAPCVASLDFIYQAEVDLDDDDKLRIYVLCPGTTFQVATSWAGSYQPINGQIPFNIFNSNIHIICGADGKRENNCTLEGGTYQLSITKTVNNVLFQGITFRGNHDESNVIAAGGDVSFSDCVFEENAIQDVLYITRASNKNLVVTVENCVFRDNYLTRSQSDREGTVIGNEDAKVVIKNTLFENNYATNAKKGHVVHNKKGGELVLTQNCFNHNKYLRRAPVYNKGDVTTLQSNYVSPPASPVYCLFVYNRWGDCDSANLDHCPLVPSPAPSPTTPQPTYNFQASCTANDMSSYNMCMDSLNYGTYTKDWRLDLQAAVDRWEKVIVGDLPSVRGEDLEGKVPICTGLPAIVDDIYMCAHDPYIDGTYGVIGSAGWRRGRYLTNGKYLPIAGEIRFDQKDIERLMQERPHAWNALLLHEIGHVLGIGTLWDDVVTNKGTESDPNWVYNGEHACNQWSSLEGCSGCPPIENDYGYGTAGKHWDEKILDTEVMTGFVEREFVPLSRITVGSLEDIGYEVDYSGADEFPSPCSNRKKKRTRMLRQLAPTGRADDLSEKGSRAILDYAKSIFAETQGSDTSNYSAGALYDDSTDVSYVDSRTQALSVIYEEDGKIFVMDVVPEQVGL